MGGSTQPHSANVLSNQTSSFTAGWPTTGDVNGTNYNRGNQSHTSSGQDSCQLMDAYGVIVQVVLAVLAFSILLLKWYREPVNERRSKLVWFADTTKQLVGAGLVHILNVIFSSLNSVDPCTWYLINFVLDCTVGLIVIYAVLALARLVGKLKGWASLNSGEYGDPFRCSYWLIQCGVYVVAMLTEKMSVLGFVQAHFWNKVANVILPIKDQRIRIVIVMLIVPFIFNALMFWVVDNILKRRKKTKSPVTESLLHGKSLEGPDVALRLTGRRYAKLTQEALSDDTDIDLAMREQVV